MKQLKLTVLLLAAASVLFSCKKGDDEEVSDCQDANTTTVTYTNNSDVPMSIKVATSLTSQFEPINPILTIDLQPGQSVVKEIEANKYFTVWYNNCSSSCNMAAYYNKTYGQCQSYEEKLQS